MPFFKTSCVHTKSFPALYNAFSGFNEIFVWKINVYKLNKLLYQDREGKSGVKFKPQSSFSSVVFKRGGRA